MGTQSRRFYSQVCSLFLFLNAVAADHVCSGSFIDEYCGEVYDQAEFERRQQEYEAAGHLHFYFMSLDAHHVRHVFGS